MEILDETLKEFSGPLEAAYIQFFQEQEFDLANHTAGGENPPAAWGNKHNLGRKITEETREKLRISRTGKNNHNFGKMTPLKTRAKIQASLLGRKMPEETKSRLRAVNLGNKYCLGKTLSLEHRARISAGLLKFNTKKDIEYGRN